MHRTFGRWAGLNSLCRPDFPAHLDVTVPLKLLVLAFGARPNRVSRRIDEPDGRSRGHTVCGVKARDLAQQLPTVTVDTPALEAAHYVATQRLPGIAVLDTDGTPLEVLTASELLRAVIPGPIQDDPSLAGVMDEASADRLCTEGLSRRKVADLMRPRQHRIELASVKPDATVIECAATMARLRSPALVVLDGARLLGVVTAAHLLEVLLERSS